MKLRESVMGIVFFLTACISALAVALICLYLFGGGIPVMGKIGWSNFFGSIWKPTKSLYGIWPMILGSLYATLGATILGGGLGLLTAIFLARFCPGRLYRICKPAVNLMAGIPSVVYGMFGLMVLVPMLRSFTGGTGKGLLTVSLLLGLMILPTVTSVAESALRAAPEAYYEGSLALGASREWSVFRVQLPAAAPGVLSGIILGIGRAIGETMAVVMVAGNQPAAPSGLLSGLRTLTANIVLEMGYASGMHRQALIATGVVLFAFILLINLGFTLVKRRDR